MNIKQMIEEMLKANGVRIYEAHNPHDGVLVIREDEFKSLSDSIANMMQERVEGLPYARLMDNQEIVKRKPLLDLFTDTGMNSMCLDQDVEKLIDDNLFDLI